MSAFSDEEHLFYYKIYRNMVGVLYMSANKAKTCPDCDSNIEQGASVLPNMRGLPYRASPRVSHLMNRR